jgi:hypothetical protein
MRNQLKWVFRRFANKSQTNCRNKIFGAISIVVLLQNSISSGIAQAGAVPQQISAAATTSVVKVRLGVSGIDNEWIHIDRNPQTGVLNIYHTTRVRQALLSDVATGLLSAGAGELVSTAIDGYNGPVPTPNLNFYRWADHQTRRLFFVADSCAEPTPAANASPPSCAVSGTSTIALSQNTDIRAGTWTIEYAEEDLIRTITFRIPKA